MRDGQTLLSLSMNSGQIFYIQKNDILPTQAREGQTFPRVVPRAKSNLPLLGLEEYHSRFLRGGMTFLPRLLNNQAKYSDRWEKHGYS